MLVTRPSNLDVQKFLKIDVRIFASESDHGFWKNGIYELV
jgi:hypothetical protein